MRVDKLYAPKGKRPVGSGTIPSDEGWRMIHNKHTDRVYGVYTFGTAAANINAIYHAIELAESGWSFAMEIDLSIRSFYSDDMFPGEGI